MDGYCLIYGVLCVGMNKGQVHGETVQEEQFNVRVTENKTIGGERQMNKSSLATLSGQQEGQCPRLLTKESRILKMLPDKKAKGLTVGVVLSTKIPFVGVVQLHCKKRNVVMTRCLLFELHE